MENFNGPVMASSDDENSAKAGEFGKWSKCFCVVDTIYLSESVSDESCFALGDVTVGVLDVKNPLGSNNVLASWVFDNGPSVRFAKGLKLLLHGLLPHWPI